jgi:hypothetical protein
MPDLKPTATMARLAEKGLKWREEYGRGGTSVGVARARDISNRSDLSLSTVKRMVSFFARHRVDLKAPAAKPGHPQYPSAGVIAWLLWGGDPSNPDGAGHGWAKRKVAEYEGDDKRKTSRREGGEYKAMNEQNLDLTASVDWVEAAEQADDTPSLRRFSMVAYTGGEMQLAGWNKPVIVDLAGLEVTEKARPILKDHDPSRIVGHTDGVENDGETLRVTGVMSAANTTAEEVINSSANGFPWQASIGARAVKVERIAKGKTTEVNGRSFTGPVFVARRARLGEVSFVALGADDATHASVAASQSQNLKESDMDDFVMWCEAKGFNEGELTDGQRQSLLAAFEAEATETEEVTETNGSIDAETVVNDIRAAAAAEADRVTEIRKITAGNSDIESEAISAGWDATRTELEVLRAARPVAGAPMINSGTDSMNEKSLEAAACMSAGISEDVLAKSYDERTLDAADGMRHIGLRELAANSAKIEGASIPTVFGDGNATIKAAFSTASLSNILENVMGKALLESYQTLPVTAMDVCRVSSVSDFKQVSRVRLNGTGAWDTVGNQGELTYGKMDDTKYTNQAETYGQIVTLSRQDVVNDDLNAFLDVPRAMGRYAAAAIDHAFFTLLLGNGGSFFSSGNGNLTSGAAFGSAELAKLVETFRKQKAGPNSGIGADSIPVNVRPEMLMVPVELEHEAEQLLGSANLITGENSTQGEANPHRGKYRVVSAPHLSDTAYTGNSATATYLFANPNALPAFELAFLNGRRQPTIERVAAPANVLGISFRGYIDFGVAAMDPKGAAKSAGA